MDRLDVAILRTLLLDSHGYPTRSEIRQSQASIARKLLVSKQTVKHRIDGYKSSGFLRGWALFPNPNLLGQGLAQARLEVLLPSSKKDVISKVRLVDGVWHVANHHGNALGVGLSYENEASLKNRLELVARICGSKRVSLGRIAFPPCEYRFAPVDVRLIQAANGEPWQSIESIAKRAGVSTRTVKRRLDSMIDERAIFVSPNLDPTRLKGAIVTNLMVFFASRSVASAAEREVVQIVNEKFWGAIRGLDYAWFELVIDNIADAGRILAQVKMLDGIKEAYLDVVEEHLPQHQVFAMQIEALAQGLVKRDLPIASSHPRARAAGRQTLRKQGL